MNSSIFIPEKIKVGFQNRVDTYTKKLAYIIYYDEKGKLRKEKSWTSWRNPEITPEDFENIPTEGFVLNKKAGGYSSGWNHRQTYVRVFDPRGFEFEISVPNLLYILENTNSIKGKGLEGEFVYGWDGTELVLLPTSTKDYRDIMAYTKTLQQAKKFKTSDMIPGATYLTKENKEIVYIGKFDSYYWSGEKKKAKHFYFYEEGREYTYFTTMTTLSKIIDVVSEEPVANFATLRDKLEHTPEFSPIDRSRDKYTRYTYEDFVKSYEKTRWFTCYNKEKQSIRIHKHRTADSYVATKINDGWALNDREYQSLKKVFNLVKPMYRSQYLKNGNLYSEGK